MKHLPPPPTPLQAVRLVIEICIMARFLCKNLCSVEGGGGGAGKEGRGGVPAEWKDLDRCEGLEGEGRL